MHSSQIILALTLVAAVSPAVAAPLPAPGSKSDNTKFARAFTEEAGLQARAPASFGPLGKELLKGLAGGAGLSALFGGISALTGGNQKRELDERGIGSVIGKLVGGTDDALSTVIKNGAISGAAFGTSSSLSGGLLDKVFGREFDERSIGSVIGKLVGGTDDALSTVVKNGAISGAAFGTSSSLGGGFLDKVFGRDELEARAPISFGPLGKELLKGLAGGAGLSAVFGGISALTGGNQRRELGDNLTQEEADELERQLEAVMNDKSELSRRQGVAGAVAKSGLGSLIGKAIVGGLGSAVGGFGVDQIFKSFQGRDLGDNLTQEEADELERQLEQVMASQSPSKRELEARILPFIVGTIASTAGGFGIDKLLSKIKGRELGDNLTQEEADELERQLEQAMASQTPSKRELEARILPFIVGTIASTAGGFGIDKLLSKIKGRELGDNLTQEEADELERQLEAVMANQPSSKRELEARINLGPLSKGLIGLGTSLGVSTVVGQGLGAVQGLFQREASLNDLD